MALELIRPMAERFPAARDRLDDLVEIVVRLAISVVLFDSELVRSDDDLRRFLTRAMDRIVATDVGSLI